MSTSLRSVAPTTIHSKVLMRELVTEKGDWDDLLPLEKK